MKKKNKILRTLIPIVVILLAIAALFVFVFIPIYSKDDNVDRELPEVIYYEGDNTVYSMENDRLLFEMDGGTTRFSVTDKVTGEVWKSNPDGYESDPLAVASKREALGATMNLTYISGSRPEELDNNTYSIKNQNYNIIQNGENEIRVDYAIGKIERTFLLPNVITKERFDAVCDQLSSKDTKKLKKYYTLYDPAKLDKKENKDEIIAMYPSVTEQALYVLKSDVKTSQKSDVESFFMSAGYTMEDLELDNQLMAGERSNNGPVFNLSVIYRLEGDDLVVEVPYSTIRYEEEAYITYISVLPYFGAAGTDQEGYMLVPEGGGALIHYNNGKTNQSAYYSNNYGWDYGLSRGEVVSETKNGYGVFGMNRENGSFICIMEGASAYGAVTADISGKTCSYNTIYGKYYVLHSDAYDVTGRSPQVIYMYENAIPDDVLVQRYRFVSGNSYVDMADCYGKYLESVPGAKEDIAGEDMPVNVEVVGAIDKVVQKAGIPVDDVIPTTSFEQTEEIIDELKSAGIENLSIRVTGWSNGGVKQSVLTNVNTLRELGGNQGMEKLIATAKDKGVALYFDGITCFAYDSDILDGFLPYANAARFTTREYVKMYPYDIVTYQQSDWVDPFYLVKPTFAQQCASNLINKLRESGAEGIAFRDIGNLLSADYNPSQTVDRETMKNMNEDTLREAVEAGLNITIKYGNDYAVPYAKLVTDMNLSGNAYAILDEKIPFYQMALHSFKDYTGEAINLDGDYQTALLECAEYGAGLNFTVMSEDPIILRDSAYSCYSSSSYDRWKDQIIEMATRYQQEMKGLNKTEMIAHEMLTDSVAMTMYRDGTKVYVNYGEDPYEAGTVIVPARDYLVERGEKE